MTDAVWPDGAREAVDAAHATWIGLHAWDDRTIDDLVLTALEPFVQQRIEAATRALDDDCRSLRDLQSWVADAVGLAPYMGCYVQDDVLPSVRRVVSERDALRAEVARLTESNAAWVKFADAIGKIVNCLYSVVPDGNGHILKSVARLREDGERRQSEVLQLRALVAALPIGEC